MRGGRRIRSRWTATAEERSWPNKLQWYKGGFAGVPVSDTRLILIDEAFVIHHALCV
jgi:hypothetical protein